MKKVFHDKAWNYLEQAGIPLGKRMMVRSHFATAYKDEYPFITSKLVDDILYYHSEIEEIDTFLFKTEKEVILANAIFENIKDKFNKNEFVHLLKFTFRILGVETDWK